MSSPPTLARRPTRTKTERPALERSGTEWRTALLGRGREPARSGRRERHSALWLVVAIVSLLALVATPVEAHEFRPALLRLIERPTQTGEAGGRFDLRLVTPRLSTAGPIPDGALTPIVPAHCELRPTHLDCGERGLVGELGVAGLDVHPVDVLVEVRYVGGARFTAVLGPDAASVSLEPAGAGAGEGRVFARYVGLGVEHILLGLDHLLFVLGLVLLVGDAEPERAGAASGSRGARSGRGPRLVLTITAFTLAHSVTLAASTLELIRLPGPPVEAGIALSILLLARELALGHDCADSRDTWTWRYPWLVAFAFGLLHGFGFAGALAQVGLPADRIPTALLAFNVGVELGQLGVVAALLASFAGLRWLGRRSSVRPGIEAIVRRAPIWAMGSLAFAWTLERVLGFWS